MRSCPHARAALGARAGTRGEEDFGGCRFRMVESGIIQGVEVMNIGEIQNVNGRLTGSIATRTIGRRYRCSYIEQRLRYLAHGSILMRLAHLGSIPLRLMPERRIAFHLGDMVGVVADRQA